MCIDDYIKELDSRYNVHYLGEMDYEMAFNKYERRADMVWTPKYKIIMDVKNGKIQVYPYTNMSDRNLGMTCAAIDVHEWNLYFKVMELAIDQLGQNEVKNS